MPSIAKEFGYDKFATVASDVFSMVGQSGTISLSLFSSILIHSLPFSYSDALNVGWIGHVDGTHDVAFGQRRGVCQHLSCDCLHYRRAVLTVDGGPCANCGHYPAAHRTVPFSSQHHSKLDGNSTDSDTDDSSSSTSFFALQNEQTFESYLNASAGAVLAQPATALSPRSNCASPGSPASPAVPANEGSLPLDAVVPTLSHATPVPRDTPVHYYLFKAQTKVDIVHVNSLTSSFQRVGSSGSVAAANPLPTSRRAARSSSSILLSPMPVAQPAAAAASAMLDAPSKAMRWLGYANSSSNTERVPISTLPEPSSSGSSRKRQNQQFASGPQPQSPRSAGQSPPTTSAPHRSSRRQKAASVMIPNAKFTQSSDGEMEMVDASTGAKIDPEVLSSSDSSNERSRSNSDPPNPQEYVLLFGLTRYGAIERERERARWSQAEDCGSSMLGDHDRVGPGSSLLRPWAKRMQAVKQEIAEEKNKVFFGVSLEEVLARPNETEPVPSLVRFMITILRERAIKEEGLFRISEKVEKVAQLRHNIDKGDTACILTAPNHAVANLLKLYIKSLPAPLLSWNYWKRFMVAIRVDDDGNRIAYLQSLVRICERERERERDVIDISILILRWMF